MGYRVILNEATVEASLASLKSGRVVKGSICVGSGRCGLWHAPVPENPHFVIVAVSIGKRPSTLGRLQSHEPRGGGGGYMRRVPMDYHRPLYANYT